MVFRNDRNKCVLGPGRDPILKNMVGVGHHQHWIMLDEALMGSAPVFVASVTDPEKQLK